MIVLPTPQSPLTNNGLKAYFAHLEFFTKGNDHECIGTVVATPSGHSLIDVDFESEIGHKMWHIKLDLYPVE